MFVLRTKQTDIYNTKFVYLFSKFLIEVMQWTILDHDISFCWWELVEGHKV